MHRSTSSAMRIEGNDHLIEYNEIHSVVYEFDDQAGIDMFGNPAYRGNVIRFNFWHHIGSGHNVAGQAGIRLDDFISAVHVYGNVFYRSAGGRFGGVQIHGGKDNVVDNNLFVDCKYALSFSPWGNARWLERLARDSTKAAVSRGGVDITAESLSDWFAAGVPCVGIGSKLVSKDLVEAADWTAIERRTSDVIATISSLR
mgnify:CR=1 FL=1